MKQVTVSEIKGGLARYLRLAEKEEVVITRRGKPVGVLTGFQSEDDWFDYQLEHDSRFLKRVAQARESLKAGKGVPLEQVREMFEKEEQARRQARPRRTARRGRAARGTATQAAASQR